MMKGTMMNYWCLCWVVCRSGLVEVLGRMMGAIGMGSWGCRMTIDRGCRSCVRMVGAICRWGRGAIMMTVISRRCYCCTMMILIGRSVVMGWCYG